MVDVEVIGGVDLSEILSCLISFILDHYQIAL